MGTRSDYVPEKELADYIHYLKTQVTQFSCVLDTEKREWYITWIESQYEPLEEQGDDGYEPAA